MTPRTRLHTLLLTLAAASTSAAPSLVAQSPAGSLDNLAWRAIGPAVMGGRIDDVAVDERQPSTIYVGSASGGVWKTTNRGTTWAPVFDDQGTASIGDIAIAPGNPDLVWVGTGEANNRQSSSFGDGVYKSVDGGRTWAHMGLRDTQAIGRIVIDPVDSEIVYVAAVGHLWGANRERGLFKTTDGGRSWTNTKYIDDDTGFTDLVMDPRNRMTLYAASYQRRRVPWGFNGGGPGSAIYKTTDGARTWTKLTAGLPDGNVGRIGLDVSRSNPQVVYATIEHKSGGTFRSDDGGASWKKVNELNPRPMYYSQIRVDPVNDQRVYVLGASFYVSTDGGRTFADPVTGRVGPNNAMSSTYDVGVHGDHHALWIDPADPNHLVLGNDGGLYFSYDGSVSWDKVANIPLGQFYGIGVDMQTPYFIYGGLQDTHSWGGPSATRHQIGILNADWFQTNFGDGHYAQPDPSDPETLYTESQDGTLSRFHRATGDRKPIKPLAGAGEQTYRFNWTTPVLVSPHDPKTLYVGGNRLFKSTDRGDSWSATPDLTRREDRDELEIMGMKPSADMLSRNDGVTAYGTLTSVAESPVTPGVLWVGTDDGLVQLSKDDGKTWTNVTERMPGPARKGRVSRVVASHRDARTALVAFDRHQDDDFLPYLYVTSDEGRTWRSLAGGLPRAGWINVVVEHSQNPNLLFVGTETGLFASLDGGQRWMGLRGSFPTVPVDDLVIHPRDNDLVVGTHGRSIYVLDDIGFLSGATAEALGAASHLFQPRPASVMLQWKQESYGAQRQFVGPNPPLGMILNYHLKSAADAAPAITIVDGQGATVRKLTGPKDAGFQRVVWDLRAEGPGVPNVRGPFVVPGTYTVRLSANGVDTSRTVVVKADPASPVSVDGQRARFTLLSAAAKLMGTLQAHQLALGAMTSGLEELVRQLEGPSGTGTSSANAAVPQYLADAKQVLERARALLRRIAPPRSGDGEEGGGPPSGIRAAVATLIGDFEGGGVQQGTLFGPTPGQQQRLQTATSDVATLDGDMTALKGSLAKLNDDLASAKVPRVKVS
ncbi:MAG: hypothetical protein U0Q12_24655 [Vicinamibacterales bacterium]